MAAVLRSLNHCKVLACNASLCLGVLLVCACANDVRPAWPLCKHARALLFHCRHSPENAWVANACGRASVLLALLLWDEVKKGNPAELTSKRKKRNYAGFPK